MADKLVAPSMPNLSSENNYNNIDIDKKPKKQGFFTKILGLKHKEDKKNNESLNNNKEIKKDTQLNINKLKNEDKNHFLNQISEIEKDLQLNKKTQTENKNNNIQKPIEDFYYDKNKENITKESNIEQLRKALGIIKNDSEKFLKAKEFRDNLFNKDQKDQDIVTDISLEEKLAANIEIPPSEEVKHIKIGITMDTEISEKKSFKISDGRKLKSLKDLKNVLENMDNSVFSSHVYAEKNDFANWIEHVMKEPELAKIIRKCKTREILLSVLTSLEKKEIEDLIEIKEKDILDEHRESLKELSFLNNERQELNKEKDSIQILRQDFEKKLEELRQREIKFRTDIEQAKTDKIGINEKQKTLLKEEESFKSDLEEQYKQKQQEAIKAKKDYLETIKNQTEKLDNIRKELLIQTQKYKDNLEQDYKQRKQQHEEEYAEKFKNLKETDKQRKQQHEEEYAEKFKNLKETEIEFKKEQTEINKLYQEKLEELKIEEQKITELQEELKEQELSSMQRENETRKYLALLNKKLIETKKKDDDINSKLKINNNLLAEIKQRESALIKKERDIEHGAFQKYLGSELSSLLEPEEKISVEDRLNQKEIGSIYGEIESCKKLLEKNKLKEAKAAYNEIRKIFYSANLPKHEKEILLNILKDLYIDINTKTT